MTSPRYSDFFERFLYRLADPERPDRAALAALRRGLGKRAGEAPEMIEHVSRHLPPQVDPAGDACEPFYLVASLFALHPKWKGAGINLGASLRAHSRRSESTDLRFRALLGCSRDRLAQHLRHLISLLKADDIPIDYAALLLDLEQWDWRGRPVQRRWGRAYWRRDEPASDRTQASS